MYYKLKGIYNIVSYLFLIFIFLGFISGCLGEILDDLESNYVILCDILTYISLFGLLIVIIFIKYFITLESKIELRKSIYKENLNKRKKLWKLKCDIEEVNTYITLMQIKQNI